MGAGLTSPVRGGDKADATVRILGIAMVLAVVHSAMTPSAAHDKSGAAPSHG
jgi:hypothetical protein